MNMTERSKAREEILLFLSLWWFFVLPFLWVIWFERLKRVVILTRNGTKAYRSCPFLLLVSCLWKTLEDYYLAMVKMWIIEDMARSKSFNFCTLSLSLSLSHTEDLNLCSLDKYLSRRKILHDLLEESNSSFQCSGWIWVSRPLNHFRLYLSRTRKYIMFLVGCDHCLSSCYPSDLH